MNLIAMIKKTVEYFLFTILSNPLISLAVILWLRNKSPIGVPSFVHGIILLYLYIAPVFFSFLLYKSYKDLQEWNVLKVLYVAAGTLSFFSIIIWMFLGGLFMMFDFSEGCAIN